MDPIVAFAVGRLDPYAARLAALGSNVVACGRFVRRLQMADLAKYRGLRAPLEACGLPVRVARNERGDISGWRPTRSEAGPSRIAPDARAALGRVPPGLWRRSSYPGALSICGGLDRDGRPGHDPSLRDLPPAFMLLAAGGD